MVDQSDEVAGVLRASMFPPCRLINPMLDNRRVKVPLGETVKGIGNQPHFVQLFTDALERARAEGFDGGVFGEPQPDPERIGPQLFADGQGARAKVV